MPTKEELEAQIESLKSELVAYKEREERGALSAQEGEIKRFLKGITFYKHAKNANSPLGKIIRLPRTVLRTAKNPSTLGYKKTNSHENNRLFYPIEFYMGGYDEPRVNLILENYDEEMIAQAFELANQTKSELRIVLTNNDIDLKKIKAIINEKNLKKPSLLTFYSSKKQKESGRKVFKLEIGKQDIFITKAWSKNEKN